MNLYKCAFLSADVSTESLDLIFDPDKAAKREQDILASQEDARDEDKLLTDACNYLIYFHRNTYTNIDLERSYPNLFELLWYSQIPCFDVTATSNKPGYGNPQKLKFVSTKRGVKHNNKRFKD